MVLLRVKRISVSDLDLNQSQQQIVRDLRVARNRRVTTDADVAAQRTRDKQSEDEALLQKRARASARMQEASKKTEVALPSLEEVKLDKLLREIRPSAS